MSSSSLRRIVKSLCLILCFTTGAVTMIEAATLTPPSIAAAGRNNRVENFSRISPTPIACNRKQVQSCLDRCYDMHRRPRDIDPRRTDDPRVRACREECGFNRC